MGSGDHHGSDSAIWAGVAFGIGGINHNVRLVEREGSGLDMQGLHAVAEDATVGQG